MRDILRQYADRARSAQAAIDDLGAGPVDWESRARAAEAALLNIREQLHPRAMGRAATNQELYAISIATMVLRDAGVLPTTQLEDAT